MKLQGYEIKIYLEQEKYKRDEVLRRAYKVELHSLIFLLD